MRFSGGSSFAVFEGAGFRFPGPRIAGHSENQHWHASEIKKNNLSAWGDFGASGRLSVPHNYADKSASGRD